MCNVSTDTVTTKTEFLALCKKIKQANMNNLLIDNKSKCKTDYKTKQKKQQPQNKTSGGCFRKWV